MSRPTEPTGSSFSFIGLAREICVEPYLTREEDRERVRIAAHRHEADRSRGVCQSGMSPDPIRRRTPAEIHADAIAAQAQAAAFAQSPQGRFLMAVRHLETLGYGREAEKCRACMDRGFMSDRTPANSFEIGRAEITLLRIDPSDDLARPHVLEAVLALAELLTAGSIKMAAE